MSVVSTKGLICKMTKAGVTPLALVPTAISSADPAVVTVADASGVANGDLVRLANTGFDELDNRMFPAAGVTATTFELTGADTSATTGSLAASPTATVYKVADMVSLCLSEIALENAEPATIDVSTFCNPGAALPGNPTPGTVTLSGYVDIADAGYSELLAAAEDGAARALSVQIPSNGELVGLITISSVTYDLPIEGAAGFSASGAMSLPLAHRF